MQTSDTSTHKKNKNNRYRTLLWLTCCTISLSVAFYISSSRFNTLKDRPSAQTSNQNISISSSNGHFEGDLGGMIVSIPVHYISDVEYDSNATLNKENEPEPQHKTQVPKFRSFGISHTFTNTTELPKSVSQHPDNLDKDATSINTAQISISINAGEYYPKLGAMAANAHAKRIADNISNPSKYWFDNYERLSEDFYGLEMYAVTAPNPKTGQENNIDDTYISRVDSGEADLVIHCNKGLKMPSAGYCTMRFGLEPEARVFVKVRFERSLLPFWKEIRKSSKDLLFSFETQAKPYAKAQ